MNKNPLHKVLLVCVRACTPGTNCGPTTSLFPYGPAVKTTLDIQSKHTNSKKRRKHQDFTRFYTIATRPMIFVSGKQNKSNKVCPHLTYFDVFYVDQESPFEIQNLFFQRVLAKMAAHNAHLESIHTETHLAVYIHLFLSYWRLVQTDLAVGSLKLLFLKLGPRVRKQRLRF